HGVAGRESVRRLWVRQGLPCREAVSRREDRSDLRGHVEPAAADDRETVAFVAATFRRPNLNSPMGARSDRSRARPPLRVPSRARDRAAPAAPRKAMAGCDPRAHLAPTRAGTRTVLAARSCR